MLGVVHASEESLEAQMAVQDVEMLVENDRESLAGFRCGGLLSASDDRVRAYYARERGALECVLDFSCSSYGDDGECTGTKCSREGAKWVVHDCRDGVCSLRDPEEECRPGRRGSRLRHWECKGNVQAQCYSFDLDLQYDPSLRPFVYNCVITYQDSPVHSDEPSGQSALVTPFSAP